MNFLTRALRAFWQEESALAAVEYGVLFGLLLAACILVLSNFGTFLKEDLEDLYGATAKKITEIKQ